MVVFLQCYIFRCGTNNNTSHDDVIAEFNNLCAFVGCFGALQCTTTSTNHRKIFSRKLFHFNREMLRGKNRVWLQNIFEKRNTEQNTLFSVSLEGKTRFCPCPTF